MDTKKMYAYIADIGENCFDVTLYCDGEKGKVTFWSDGDEIALSVDQPGDHSEALEWFVLVHANFTRLIRFCRRVLRLSRFGYADEVPVSFCFR